jgi:hypothetical protein
MIDTMARQMGLGIYRPPHRLAPPGGQIARSGEQFLDSLPGEDRSGIGECLIGMSRISLGGPSSL